MINIIVAKSFLSALKPLLGEPFLFHVDNIGYEIYELRFSKLVPSETGEIGISPMKLYITEKKMYEVLDQNETYKYGTDV